MIDLSHRAKTPHLGSSLSCVDILVAAYWSDALGLANANASMPYQRNRFILSKGHAAIALYATLAHRGIISMDLLDNYAQPGSALAEQPIPGAVPGIDVATGSLGHGLSVALGMAIAARIQRSRPSYVVVMSDGECNEGSVWEAALFASAQKLGNVTVVIDFNKWQATGRSTEILSIEPLREKWEAFGWESHDVDGHNIEQIQARIANEPERECPVALIAHTIKGRGVSFMEDDNNWHYRIPTDDEREKAHRELGLL